MVDELLDRLQKTYAPRGDPRKASEMAAYMRDRFVFLGIQTQPRRRLSKQIVAGLPRPSERQLGTALRRIWKLPEREYHYFGCEYFIAQAGGRSPRVLDLAHWLVTHHSWWDSVDALAAHGVGNLVREHPGLAREMDVWVDTEDFWVARSAILHQLRYKGATNERRLFDHCLRRARDSEFFVRKAIGWALREYSKTAPRAVERFVRSHADELSPLSRREALKWLARRRASR